MEPAAILNLIVSAFQAGSAWGSTAQPSFLQSWAEFAASALISSLWQGAVVASGLALCMRLAPSIPARLRYGIWAAGFAALLGLPFLPALVHYLTPSAFSTSPAHSFGVTAVSGMASAYSSSPRLELDARWSLAIAALWIAASLVRAAGLAANSVRMSRLWNSASPVESINLDASFQNVTARSAAFRAPAQLCITSELDRPCVIGFFRPRILIPAWLLERLTHTELEQVVLHESEHLRRMDDWTNLLQKLCLVLFPLNPALWWLERRLCAEREMACDDGVVGRTHAPRAYAACLAGLAEKGLKHREAALSLGAWQRRPELAARVHRLLRRPTVLSPVASWAAVGAVGCGLVVGVLGLAHSPQLVGFVAPAAPASHEVITSANALGTQQGLVDTDFAQGTATFDGHRVQQYRAVKTMAILPAGRSGSVPRKTNAVSATRSLVSAAPTDVEAQQPNNVEPSGHALASLVPEAIAAKMKAQQVSQQSASLPNSQATATQTSTVQANSRQPGATQTGWLVLTTYEEVETTGSEERVRGDAIAGETLAAAATNTKPTTNITVTRLVLRLTQPAHNGEPTSNVVQPNSNAQPASNVSPTPNTQPAANSTQPFAIPYRDGWLVIQL
jgi:beta-lactamase regulating signal transducer with metallopeptidase domain